MRKKNYISIIISLFIFCGAYADPRIVLFFQAEHMTDAEKISAQLKKPGKLAKYTARGMVTSPIVEGIIATYGGYVAASDYNGELSFIRRHQKNNVVVVITPEIVPVVLFESTITTWKRLPGVPAAMYRCEQIYDAQKGGYFVKTEEIPLSEDMSIPLAAVIIIAQPKNIRMEVGNSSAVETGNFIVPTLYVKKGIDTLKNSSYILTIRHLFKPTQTEENREPLKILTQISD